MLSSFHRDTWAEIDLDAIFYNVQSMKQLLDDDVEIIAVVKANAYGHGDVQVARTALEAGATRVAVAFLDEALSLRKKGIDVPILVLGAVRPEDVVLASKENITLTVFQTEWLEKAIQYGPLPRPVALHLKLDTGMGRLGVKEEEEVKRIVELIEENDDFFLEGVYTHFATADELNTTYFEFQYETFLQMLEWLPKRPPIVHCGNSATALRFRDKVFNAIRLGIAMYGLSPSLEMKPLLPYPLKEAFSLHSRLVHVKQLKAGEKVSYGATYTAEKDEWIGTVPIGYADGWLRKLQNFCVLVNGTRVPIVGRICMDQFMIRLPEPLPVGTKVTLIGEQQGEKISIDEVATYLNTINYEIPCTISYRVPRIFLKNKSIIEVRNALL
ncbi:alanine racemase [Thermolongibacillus altinsuensis]|uniref:Alanine racemase n=1 Tax=Thermolongibacillus altinsuensis TaxID=575256 RepID=A0A4R1QD67_9BACL|nr:alanine racemase [Thermolongibacillus altinsuensis]TCL45930.1 alanine racemase [Thermolongibacillus altinsuensis]GMB09917.1 alanine racemase [Thermolongibacillus altinsuensis]